MKKEVMIVALFLLSIFSASAALIHVSTIPNDDVWISAKDPQNAERTIVNPMKFSADENGDLIINYDVHEAFKPVVLIKDGDEIVLLKKFDEIYGRDDEIDLEAYPEGYVKPVKTQNTTVVSTPIVQEETIQQENVSEDLIENKTIISENNLESKFLGYYSQVKSNANYLYIVGLLFVLFLFILIYKITKSLRKRILSIEKRIKKEEKRIQKLKEKKAKLIIKLKKQMIKQEEELIKMRGGSVPEKQTTSSMKEKLNKGITNYFYKRKSNKLGK